MMEITLEDVKTAIKILEEFLKEQRRAERILIRLGRHLRVSGGAMPDLATIYQMALQQTLARKGIKAETSEEEEDTLTEEELKRLREIAKKIKGAK